MHILDCIDMVNVIVILAASENFRLAKIHIPNSDDKQHQ